jgi:hypothetical protein
MRRSTARFSSLLGLGASLGLTGCGAAEGVDAGDPEVAVGKTTEAINGGWTTLSLMNGWTAAANSNVPAVGIVNGIVTFRGALNGAQATSTSPFCLTSPTFDAFRPTDGGYITMRAALANGHLGSARLALNHCMLVSEDGVIEPNEPGPNARLLTSLEGITFDKSYAASTPLELQGDWTSAYPERGSDEDENPPYKGVFAKVVSGFVRFQGVVKSDQEIPTVFKLPPAMGMIPGNAVHLPVTVCPESPGQRRIVIQPSGYAILDGTIGSPTCGVSFDGASYSMSSPPGAQAISLSSGWVWFSNRAVRARVDGGVVRLEGMVKNGTTLTIGTLPMGMRPAKTIFLVSSAQLLAFPAVLRINTFGTITVVSPELYFAQSGITLDGVSFGL